MHELTQWLFSTLAGAAVGYGIARMRYTSPQRKAAKALEEITADTRRSFAGVPREAPGPRPAYPPAPKCHKHLYVFERIYRSPIKGKHDVSTVYRCAHCGKRVLMPLHRKVSKSEFNIKG